MDIEWSKEYWSKATDWLKDIFTFGLALILVFLMIDLMSGESGGVQNIGSAIANFADEGLIGLIALLVFLFIYRK